MSGEINVTQRTQVVHVHPSTNVVNIIEAGPTGPPGADGSPGSSSDGFRRSSMRPSGSFVESFPRQLCGGTIEYMAESRLHLFGIPLFAGDVISSISFYSAGEYVTDLEYTWCGLFDLGLNKLAVSEEDTSPSWDVHTFRTHNITDPYNVTSDGMYYVSIDVRGATGDSPKPMFVGFYPGFAASAVDPVLSGVHELVGHSYECPATLDPLDFFWFYPYFYLS